MRRCSFQNDEGALHHAARNNGHKVARILLADPETRRSLQAMESPSGTPLTAAVARGNLEAVREMLRWGDEADFKAKDLLENTLLHLAAFGGHLE